MGKVSQVSFHLEYLLNRLQNAFETFNAVTKKVEEIRSSDQSTDLPKLFPISTLELPWCWRMMLSSSGDSRIGGDLEIFCKCPSLFQSRLYLTHSLAPLLYTTSHYRPPSLFTSFLSEVSLNL